MSTLYKWVCLITIGAIKRSMRKYLWQSGRRSILCKIRTREIARQTENICFETACVVCVVCSPTTCTFMTPDSDNDFHTPHTNRKPKHIGRSAFMPGGGYICARLLIICFSTAHTKRCSFHRQIGESYRPHCSNFLEFGLMEQIPFVSAEGLQSSCWYPRLCSELYDEWKHKYKVADVGTGTVRSKIPIVGLVCRICVQTNTFFVLFNESMFTAIFLVHFREIVIEKISQVDPWALTRAQNI